MVKWIAHGVEDQVLKGVPQVAEVLVHVEPEEELIGSRPKVGLQS
jgi:divalent metal cation (Fe/Co/Zn/Cd) transporter